MGLSRLPRFHVLVLAEVFGAVAVLRSENKLH